MRPPRAERRPKEVRQHGEVRRDPYAWLRADNWREAMRDPSLLPDDIRSHLEAENAYAEAVLAPLADLRTTLVAEMRGRIREDDSSVPEPDGRFSYYVRYEEGAEHPIHCRRDPEGTETVLVDGNRLAKGEDYCRIGQVTHSPDHMLIAYTIDLEGSECFTLAFRDPATGEDLPDRAERIGPRVAWANDSATVLYTVLDEDFRPRSVHRLTIGGSSEPVYEEGDAGFFVGVRKTESGRFIAIDAHDHTTSEVHLADADDLSGPLLAVAARRRDVEYSVAERDGRLLILTNADGAEDFRIAEARLEAPEPGNWHDIVPHRPGCLIVSLLAFRDWTVRLEREDGLPRIVVRAEPSGEEHEIAFDEEAYSLGVVPGFEFATDRLRFTYASPATPLRVYDYDMRRRTRVLMKEQQVPSGHNPADYRVRRLFAETHDGERVPITLLHRADRDPGRPSPCLLYGYGAYGISMPAGFSTQCLSLVDRGFIHATAHVRGGTEGGYRWYRTGRMEHKTNTFDDFIAAGRHLVREGFAEAGGIVAHGGSAGGMLMGAVANRAPSLFRAILAEVPFVDVLNTMSDTSLPLTPPEWPEWGNPIEDGEAYRRIAAYSPYDNVAVQRYPHVLATAGVSDPRVTYWEPAKWIAALREAALGDPMLLLVTNMSAGHGGAAGRFETLDERARLYAFAISLFS